MISDQQRGLLGQPLPTGRLEPEVVLAQGIPDRLLSPHQCLVGALEGVLGSGGDAPADKAFDAPRGARGRAVARRSCASWRTVEPSPLPGRWCRGGCHEDPPPRAWTASSLSDTARHTLVVADCSKSPSIPRRGRMAHPGELRAPYRVPSGWPHRAKGAQCDKAPTSAQSEVSKH